MGKQHLHQNPPQIPPLPRMVAFLTPLCLGGGCIPNLGFPLPVAILSSGRSPWRSAPLPLSLGRPRQTIRGGKGLQHLHLGQMAFLICWIPTLLMGGGSRVQNLLLMLMLLLLWIPRPCLHIPV